MTTIVTNLDDPTQEQTYTLPPEQAVVAAYEQSRDNWCTWTYPPPEQHPEFRTGRRYVTCGRFTAQKEKQ